MSDILLSETCVCGGTQWHVLLDRVLWCRRCGSARLILERYWKVPLDCAGELSSTVILPDGDDDVPTSPGTPEAKKTVEEEAEIDSNRYNE